MRKIYWYHEGCIPGTGARTGSTKHELCAACGKEGECVEVELNSNPDVRKTENWTMQPVEPISAAAGFKLLHEAEKAVEAISEEVAESIEKLETVDDEDEEKTKEEEQGGTEVPEVEGPATDEEGLGQQPDLEEKPSVEAEGSESVEEEDVMDEAVEDIIEAVDKKDAEIAALQAQIDALEKAK